MAYSETQPVTVTDASQAYGDSLFQTIFTQIFANFPFLAKLAGRSGGQTQAGGTGAGENYTITSTSHATKGKIIRGTSAYDEVNNREGIGTQSPVYPHDVDVNPAGTVAKLGPSLPTYIFASYPGFGFNVYTDGATKFGKGSSSNYGGIMSFDPTSGGYSFYTSTATGNADAAMTAKALLTLSQGGTVTFNQYGAGALSTDGSGNITASDIALKTNIREYKKGLAELRKLVPKIWKWKKETGWDQDHDYVGFVAQDVQAVVPEAAPDSFHKNEKGKDTKDKKILNYSDRNLMALMVNSIKELNERLEILESKI